MKAGIIKVQFPEKNDAQKKTPVRTTKSSDCIGSNSRRQERGTNRDRKQRSSEQIHKWKRQALEAFAQLFEDDRKGERAREAEHEKQINELYAEIGRLDEIYSQYTERMCQLITSTCGNMLYINILYLVFYVN